MTAEERSSNNEPIGFKINDQYFIEFPPGDFVHETETGEMFIDVIVYENTEDGIKRLKPDDMNEETTKLVNEAINNILSKAIKEALDDDK